MTTRIELSGRVLQKPEIRVTPAGTDTLRLVIDCGDRAAPVILPVVMTGAAARGIGQRLNPGDSIRAVGALRAAPLKRSSARSFEVIAERIEADATD